MFNPTPMDEFNEMIECFEEVPDLTPVRRPALHHIFFSVEAFPIHKLLVKKLIITAMHYGDEEDGDKCAMTFHNKDHYHAIGMINHTSRSLRDVSLAHVQKLADDEGIKTPITKELLFALRESRSVPIKSREHLLGAVRYIKQYEVLDANQNLLKLALNDLMEKPKFVQAHKHSIEDLEEFRRQYPSDADWKAALQFNPFQQKQFYHKYLDFENQYSEWITTKPLTQMEYKRLEPWMNLIRMITIMNHAVKAFPVGCIMIMVGSASTYKSTILRIMAQAHKPYLIMSGSTFLDKDNLKYDTAEKKGCKTIIFEELEWMHVAKKVQITDVLRQLKEMMPGGPGLNVRTAKTRNLGDGFLKLNQILISNNEREYIQKHTLANEINKEEDLKKRFVVIDADKLKASVYGSSIDSMSSELECLIARYIKNNDFVFKETLFAFLETVLTFNKDYINNYFMDQSPELYL